MYLKREDVCFPVQMNSLINSTTHGARMLINHNPVINSRIIVLPSNIITNNIIMRIMVAIHPDGCGVAWHLLQAFALCVDRAVN